MPSVGSSLVNNCWSSFDLLCPGFEVDTDRLLQESVSLVGFVSAAWPISSTGIGMSGREGRGPPEDRDDGRRNEREREEENGLVAVEDHPGFGRPGAKWSAGELPLVPELPRFGSDENETDDEESPDNSENRALELFAYPGSSPASQRQAGGGNRLGRIVVSFRAGRPVLVHGLLTQKPKLRVDTSSAAAST